MIFRRKHNSCLNCGYPLDKLYNYCPVCGQTNTDTNVSFNTLVVEFFVNYFALDSRFGRTVKPFFINPGFLTNEFMAGKRNSYAHPIRMYLVISLIYFTIFSFAAGTIVNEYRDEEVINNVEGDQLNPIKDLPDSTRLSLSKAMDDGDIKDLNKIGDTLQLEELKVKLYFFNSNDKEDIVRALDSTEIALLDYHLQDSTKDNLPSLIEIFQNKKKPDPEPVNDGIEFLEGSYFSTIDSLADIDEYSESQVVDSLKIKDISSFEYYVTRQIVRVERAGNEIVVVYIIKNMSLMMILLIPVFALILKILYRNKQLYIKHLIHAIHLHSFSYLVYGICILLVTYVLNETLANYLMIISIAMVTIYCFISFLKVYRQHWAKTFVKFILTGWIYSFFISLFITAELFISFLLF